VPKENGPLESDVNGESNSVIATETIESQNISFEARAAKILETMESYVPQVQTLVATIGDAKREALEIAADSKKASEEIHATLLKSSELLSNTASEFEKTKVISEKVTQIVNITETAKSQIEQNANLAQTRSQHVEDGRVYINEKRAEIDKILTAAAQLHANIDAIEKSSNSSIEKINGLLTSSDAARLAIEKVNEIVSATLEEAKENCKASNQLAQLAQTTEARIAAYEEKLKGLNEQAENQLKLITDLLPGATSAGLAFAFQARRKSFFWPYALWQIMFLVSLAAIATITFLEFNIIAEAAKEFTLERIGLGLLRRLPMVLPLIWLALHASRKAALAQRVEEDYGFKETVSRSFEGYRKEMVELESRATENSTVRELCNSVLGTITERPGRIYDGHPLIHTPASEVASLSPVISAIVAATVSQTIKQLKPSFSDKPQG
jgi:hypothetical protein